MTNEFINALLGGILIGVAVSLMLLLNGRVTGISGIINGTLKAEKGDLMWRIFFLLGLITGGLVIRTTNPNLFSAQITTPDWTTIIAGIIVGFGTVMGSGCTSGHGVCGISRLSIRSIVATIIFISSGILTVYLIRMLGPI